MYLFIITIINSIANTTFMTFFRSNLCSRKWDLADSLFEEVISRFSY